MRIYWSEASKRDSIGKILKTEKCSIKLKYLCWAKGRQIYWRAHWILFDRIFKWNTFVLYLLTVLFSLIKYLA